MDTQLSEEAAWAGGVAARLRILQANASEATADTQREFIAEELDRALKEVVPSKRKTFLHALADRFPAWHVAPVLVGETSVAKPEIVEDTPERRLESLLQAAPRLTEQQRTEFSARLKSAGFNIVQASGRLESTPELVKTLGGEVPQLDAERAMKLLNLVSAFVVTIDQLVWNLWKQVASRSAVRRDGGPTNDVKALMRRYLSGDSEVSSQQINQLVDQSRKLTAGLLMAMGGSGRAFAKKFQERFSPIEITELARLEKSVWEALEKRCWEKYTQLYTEFGEEAAIDNMIQEAVVRYAEEVIRGRQANA